jgi:hypothetical protein
VSTAQAPTTASSARIMFQLFPARCIGRGSVPERGKMRVAAESAPDHAAGSPV